MRGFPWREAMGFGLGVLRLSPRDFWSMTPRELRAAQLGLTGGRVAAPERQTLADLMVRFPDEVRHG